MRRQSKRRTSESPVWFACSGLNGKFLTHHPPLKIEDTFAYLQNSVKSHFLSSKSCTFPHSFSLYFQVHNKVIH